MSSSAGLSEFLLLAVAHLLALASPGPDFLLLVRSALRHGRRHALGAAWGIALGNGCHIALALCGFSLVQQSPWLLDGMKWLASAYLAWLGWLFLRASRAPATWPEQGGPPSAGGAVAGLAAGFLSALLNPKNGLFYFGLFTLMVSAHTGPGLKLLYGVWMMAVVLAWDAALVWLVTQRRGTAWLARALPLVEGGAGVLLMAAAVALAVARV